MKTLPFLLAIMLVTACSAPPEAGRVRSSVAEAMARGDDLNFDRPTEPMDFVFPRDHGPHEEYRTEWWYYTGNLEDREGNVYGYQLTFFRNALTPEQPMRVSAMAADDVYMAHFAVTDGSEKEHWSFERYSRGDGSLAGATGMPSYQVWLEDWQAYEIEPGVTRITANAEDEVGRTVAIDLRLRETTDPILHGDRGLSQKGPETGNANYYYSLTQLETDGTLSALDRTIDVTGMSWMDHEFGTSALTNGARGWDWFSVQMEDGTRFMFGEFHDGAGGNRFVYEGSLVYPDGRQVVLGDGDFDLRATSEWTSPDTGITYPSGWEAHFPQEEILLTITPLILDQEMDISFVYYEGATEVTGTIAGKELNGRGYVELTGYGDQELAEYQR